MRTVLWLAGAMALAAATGGMAQTAANVVAETRTASGLHTVSFRLPSGIIRVVFPDDVATGDTISGAVLPQPAGEGEAARQNNRDELNGYVIDIEQTRVPVARRNFQWKVAPGIAAGGAVIILRNPKGAPLARSSIPVAGAAAAPSIDFDLPTSGAGGGIVSARGPFDGDLRTTAVRIGDAPATVLAESPRQILFQPPAGRPGISTLEIRKGDHTASARFRTIGLLLSATNLHPLPGQTAVLTVTVQGLENLTEPADLMLLNRSPGIVAVQGGIEQHLVIQPAQVRPDGTYVQLLTLTGITAGDLSLTAIAGLPPTLQFDLPRTIDRAVLDWQRSTGVPITADAQRMIAAAVLQERKPVDDFLRLQEAYRGDLVSVADMLVRNYCFDLRDHRRANAAFVLSDRIGILAFVPPPPKLAIDAKDVGGFSFARFLSQLLARLSPNQPVGYLMVSSRPDQAPISVDNHSGPDRTNRKFLVSAGTHTVVVNRPAGACRKSIQVQPFQTGIIACI